MQNGKLFLIEESLTPILQRINVQIVGELSRRGHQVIMVPAATARDRSAYIDYVAEAEPDYFIIANPFGYMCGFNPAEMRYLFEIIETSLIFIHHENLCANARSIEDAATLLTSYQRVSRRAHHFCIEHQNYIDLRRLGIENAHPAVHCTEFTQVRGSVDDTDQNIDLSFVGHVLDGNLHKPGFQASFPHVMLQDYYGRLTDFSRQFEPSAVQFASAYAEAAESSVKPNLEAGAKYFYHSLANSLTLLFRGDVIRGIGDREIHIVGGDPNYLKGSAAIRMIEKPSIHYHKPTKAGAETALVYARSKISLNITSLQFDRSVINRVLDIGACGGFPLTDWKQDLDKVTCVATEISYRSIEELNHKIDYYLHPDHAREKAEIALAFQTDVFSKCTYAHFLESVLEIISKRSVPHTAQTSVVISYSGQEAPYHHLAEIKNGTGEKIVFELECGLPFPTNSVERMRAEETLQYLRDPIHSMNEIWRVCKHNALVDLEITGIDGREAVHESGYKSFWDRRDLQNYCIQYPAFLCQSRSKGFKGAFRLEHLQEDLLNERATHLSARLRVLKPSPEEIHMYSLRDINLIISLNGDPDIETESTWPNDLRRLMIAASQRRQGSKYCFILDGSPLGDEQLSFEVGAAMFETMLIIRNPPSGDYPGVCILPKQDNHRRKLLLRMASTTISLREAVTGLEADEQHSNLLI